MSEPSQGARIVTPQEAQAVVDDIARFGDAEIDADELAYAYTVATEPDRTAAVVAPLEAVNGTLQEVLAVRDEQVRVLTEDLRKLRAHKISDRAMHDLHENAKNYSLAVRALNKVRGGQLSTTLAYLIEQGYLVPAQGEEARTRAAVVKALRRFSFLIPALHNAAGREKNERDAIGLAELADMIENGADYA